MAGGGRIRRVVTGHDGNGRGVVLDGEICLALDEAEDRLQTGDRVIQRGTDHAWSNRSGKPVRMLCVLIDAQFDAALAAHLARAQGR